ncbi:transposable element Tcb1 transposase [Trichonephila clavipes]|nr:transposable element Tcb1 transposase [Trichonephila clavipes]
MARRKGLSHNEITILLRDISENDLDGDGLSCSNLDSDEDIRLSESDCEESEESVDIIDNIACDNRIVMAQRKHFDDFVRGRIIGRLECRRSQLEVSDQLGIAQRVISRLWQRFQDDEHIGLYARRSVRCVPLTTTQCFLRLTWRREHVLWTPQQWSCVMFSDESRYSLQSDSRRTLKWRTAGTRYYQEDTIERLLYGGAGCLV